MDSSELAVVKPQQFQFSWKKLLHKTFGCGPLVLCSFTSVIVAVIWLVAANQDYGKGSAFLSGLFLAFISRAAITYFTLGSAYYLVWDFYSRHREARALTNRQHEIREWFARSVDDMWTSARQAEYSLQRAERCFRENAARDFWTSLQDASLHLNRWVGSLEKVSEYSHAYAQALVGREHTFPEWCAGLREIPPPEDHLHRLGDLHYKGSTDNHFAQTMLQMEILSAIRQGFAQLSEDIRHLEQTISRSLDDLRRSISFDISKLILSQKALAEVLSGVVTRRDS